MVICAVGDELVAELVEGDATADGADDESAAMWDRIVATAGRIPWTTTELHKEFEGRMGMAASEAAYAELAAFLELIEPEAAA